MRGNERTTGEKLRGNSLQRATGYRKRYYGFGWSRRRNGEGFVGEKSERRPLLGVGVRCLRVGHTRAHNNTTTSRVRPTIINRVGLIPRRSGETVTVTFFLSVFNVFLDRLFAVRVPRQCAGTPEHAGRRFTRTGTTAKRWTIETKKEWKLRLKGTSK